MSVPAMIAHLLLEKLTRQMQPRVPEADLIMQEQGQVLAFMEGGRDEGILAYVYLFHAVMALPVIRPGDMVVDLACGPANQLVQMARLNPEARFIGVDASPSMVALALDTVAASGLGNVALQNGDITQLNAFANQSVDCVTCTMSLHHLPDTQALAATMREIRRILKPGGGVYLADFGRLKRAASQHYFAHDRQELQSEQFTADFLASMRAAFSPAEFDVALGEIDASIQRYETGLAPFILICRSTARRDVDSTLAAQVKAAYADLSRGQRRDFDNFVRWFKMGGLDLPCAVR
ncbi:MAG: class I SAM-dependent methyltransferase [Burkholderiales bacterium]|nr:class I SAM-dependent methyltransferase [Burkholderiales bacterium]